MVGMDVRHFVVGVVVAVVEDGVVGVLGRWPGPGVDCLEILI